MNLFSQQSSKQKIFYTLNTILSFIGILATAYLIYIHLKPAELGSFCNIDDYWNCDRVNNSIYAYLFDIPVAFFGGAFYLFSFAIWLMLLLKVNFTKLINHKLLKYLFAFTALAALIGNLIIGVYEFTVPGNLIVWVIIKTILFATATIWLLIRYWKRDSYYQRFMALLLILSLFGVNFSLYLTDMEIFVLQAICILCLTQQIIILIITYLNVSILKAFESNEFSTVPKS